MNSELYEAVFFEETC